MCVCVHHPAESVITKSQWERRTTLKHILFDLTSEDILFSQANKPARFFWIVPTLEGKRGGGGGGVFWVGFLGVGVVGRF